jgi:hypothetical protein
VSCKVETLRYTGTGHFGLALRRFNGRSVDFVSSVPRFLFVSGDVGDTSTAMTMVWQFVRLVN